MLKKLSILVVLIFISIPAQAKLEIDVTRGAVEPLPIAVTDVYASDPSLNTVAQGLTGVIKNNLRNSGLFEPMNPAGFIQSSRSSNEDGPRFPEWKAINAQALVTANLKRSNDGRLRLEFRLWDVFAEGQLIGTAYTTTETNWRRIAHIISDAIYKRVTGEDGYFDSRIVYIAEEGPANARRKRLAIMDQDGHNNKFLTSGNYLVLTPRFSPTSQEITYLAYVNNRPRVYLYNIDTGKQEVLGDFPGMTFAPRFSPDGNKVIMSQAVNGNSEILVMDLRTRRTRQLTKNPAIDTSPSFSPDGKRVVFESDRGGSQQLYVMGADGSNARRITFGQGRYGNPVWSPRGDLIAFTRIYKGNFYIGVIKPDGSGERLITTAYHVEGPSWAPNGRYLVYFKEKPVGPGGRQKSVKLHSIDLTGFNERQLPTPVGASDPAWSPLNQ